MCRRSSSPWGVENSMHIITFKIISSLIEQDRNTQKHHLKMLAFKILWIFLYKIRLHSKYRKDQTLCLDTINSTNSSTFENILYKILVSLKCLSSKCLLDVNQLKWLLWYQQIRGTMEYCFYVWNDFKYKLYQVKND